MKREIMIINVEIDHALSVDRQSDKLDLIRINPESPQVLLIDEIQFAPDASTQQIRFQKNIFPKDIVKFSEVFSDQKAGSFFVLTDFCKEIIDQGWTTSKEIPTAEKFIRAFTYIKRRSLEK